VPCQIADVLLGQTGIQQRRMHTAIRGRRLSRPEIALIVQVHAIGDAVEPAGAAKLFHHVKKLVLAVKTPRPVIADIFRPVHFRGVDDFQRNRALPGEREGVSQLSAGQAWRIGDHRKHVVAQSLMRSPGEKRRIDAAGIGNQHPAQPPETFIQGSASGSEFAGEHPAILYAYLVHGRSVEG